MSAHIRPCYNPKCHTSFGADRNEYYCSKKCEREAAAFEKDDIMAEAYQVIGVLALDMQIFENPQIQHLLTNLNEGKKIHKDVLPFVLPEKDSK